MLTRDCPYSDVYRALAKEICRQGYSLHVVPAGKQGEKMMRRAFEQARVDIPDDSLPVGLLWPLGQQFWMHATEPREKLLFTTFHEMAHMLVPEEWRDESYDFLTSSSAEAEDGYPDYMERYVAADEIIADEVACAVLKDLGLFEVVFDAVPGRQKEVAERIQANRQTLGGALRLQGVKRGIYEKLMGCMEAREGSRDLPRTRVSG